jgi:hypothetical protein
LASGEVVWARGAEKGGEFGVRFTDMDAESVDALKRICGVAGHPAPVHPGSKVRLHIGGLASPMRAKIKDALPTEVTVGSELGFLQVGRELELEDAESGNKRPANIDRVEVAVDPESHVPQLVVTLRYADMPAQADPAPCVSMPAARASVSNEARFSDDLDAAGRASVKLKGAFAHNVARIGPAFERFAQRAKTTVVLLAKRRGERVEDGGGPRRTTAPAPGGGLHAKGRGVVRGEAGALGSEDPTLDPTQRRKVTKRKGAIAAGVMTAAIVGALALKMTHHEGAQDPVAAHGATPASPPSANAETASPAATVAPSPPVVAPIPPSESVAHLGAPTGSSDESDSAERSGHKRHARVAPFGNGPVHHGNVLHLKMDGPIESIEGAQQPTGFAVKIPGRRSLEAAGPLAARDSRIAAIKVSNEVAGADLMVTFKDGVPNYQVSAKGDTLAIVLAPAGALEETWAKNEREGKSPKRARHEHERTTARDRSVER